LTTAVESTRYDGANERVFIAVRDEIVLPKVHEENLLVFFISICQAKNGRKQKEMSSFAANAPVRTALPAPLADFP
jgi:hypothetical protein